jgi:hypothetical protein
VCILIVGLLLCVISNTHASPDESSLGHPSDSDLKRVRELLETHTKTHGSHLQLKEPDVCIGYGYRVSLHTSTTSTSHTHLVVSKHSSDFKTAPSSSFEVVDDDVATAVELQGRSGNVAYLESVKALKENSTYSVALCTRKKKFLVMDDGYTCDGSHSVTFKAMPASSHVCETIWPVQSTFMPINLHVDIPMINDIIVSHVGISDLNIDMGMHTFQQSFTSTAELGVGSGNGINAVVYLKGEEARWNSGLCAVTVQVPASTAVLKLQSEQNDVTVDISAEVQPGFINALDISVVPVSTCSIPMMRSADTLNQIKDKLFEIARDTVSQFANVLLRSLWSHLYAHPCTQASVMRHTKSSNRKLDFSFTAVHDAAKPESLLTLTTPLLKEVLGSQPAVGHMIVGGSSIQASQYDPQLTVDFEFTTQTVDHILSVVSNQALISAFRHLQTRSTGILNTAVLTFADRQVLSTMYLVGPANPSWSFSAVEKRSWKDSLKLSTLTDFMLGTEYSKWEAKPTHRISLLPQPLAKEKCTQMLKDAATATLEARHNKEFAMTDKKVKAFIEERAQAHVEILNTVFDKGPNSNRLRTIRQARESEEIEESKAEEDKKEEEKGGLSGFFSSVGDAIGDGFKAVGNVVKTGAGHVKDAVVHVADKVVDTVKAVDKKLGKSLDNVARSAPEWKALLDSGGYDLWRFTGIDGLEIPVNKLGIESYFVRRVQIGDIAVDMSVKSANKGDDSVAFNVEAGSEEGIRDGLLVFVYLSESKQSRKGETDSEATENDKYMIARLHIPREQVILVIEAIRTGNKLDINANSGDFFDKLSVEVDMRDDRENLGFFEQLGRILKTPFRELVEVTVNALTETLAPMAGEAGLESAEEVIAHALTHPCLQHSFLSEDGSTFAGKLIARKRGDMFSAKVDLGSVARVPLQRNMPVRLREHGLLTTFHYHPEKSAMVLTSTVTDDETLSQGERMHLAGLFTGVVVDAGSIVADIAVLPIVQTLQRTAYTASELFAKKSSWSRRLWKLSGSEEDGEDAVPQLGDSASYYKYAGIKSASALSKKLKREGMSSSKIKTAVKQYRAWKKESTKSDAKIFKKHAIATVKSRINGKKREQTSRRITLSTIDRAEMLKQCYAAGFDKELAQFADSVTMRKLKNIKKQRVLQK